MSDTVIQVANVTHRFKRGGKPCLRNVSLELVAGETLGLVGESGSGKTTLARIILGTQSPSEGLVTRPRIGPGKPALISMVFQDVRGSMDPRYSVSELIQEASPVRPRAACRTQAIELLRLVALDPKFAVRYPHELSGGQCQRVALARALASGASVLLLDEPTSALDANVRLETLELLRTLRAERSLTLLVVSHDFQVVERLCDRVAVMCRGEILEEGMAGAVLRQPKHPYTKALIRASRMERHGVGTTEPSGSASGAGGDRGPLVAD